MLNSCAVGSHTILFDRIGWNVPQSLYHVLLGKRSNLVSQMKLKSISKVGIALFGVIAMSSSVTAQVAIDGTINMGPSGSQVASGLILKDINGSVTPNLGTAYTIDAWVSSIVVGASGAFSGLNGQAVNYFGGWQIGAPQVNLWQVGGFSFDLVSAVTNYYPADPNFPGTPDFLTVEGMGTLYGPVGFAPTQASWSFSTQGPGTPLFSWSSSTNSVPDGGATVALLGFSLLGLHGIRRKLAKR